MGDNIQESREEKQHLDITKSIENVATSKVKPYENNAKKHPKSQVKQIAVSIKRNGWKQPIVVDKDFVVIV